MKLLDRDEPLDPGASASWTPSTGHSRGGGRTRPRRVGGADGADRRGAPRAAAEWTEELDADAAAGSPRRGLSASWTSCAGRSGRAAHARCRPRRRARDGGRHRGRRGVVAGDGGAHSVSGDSSVRGGAGPASGTWTRVGRRDPRAQQGRGSDGRGADPRGHRRLLVEGRTRSPPATESARSSGTSGSSLSTRPEEVRYLSDR